MKLSPPLAILSIIAAAFAWMAWEYEPRDTMGTWRIGKATTTVYYSDVYWLCGDGSREPVIRDQPNHCPQTLAGKTAP